MNIWSVIVVGLQSLTNWSGHIIVTLFEEHCCDIWPSLMKTFWHFDVDVSLMMIWCFLDIVIFLLAIFEMLLDVKLLNSLFPLIFFLRWSSRINAMLRIVFFGEYFCKVANLKLNFVESVICFEFWMFVGLTFSFFFKALLKGVVRRTAC